jgi:septin 3/9/12
MANTLFAAHLVDSKGVSTEQTTEITTVTHCNTILTTVLEENGVKLKLSITDTPGYGDQVNNDLWYSSINAVGSQSSNT